MKIKKSLVSALVLGSACFAATAFGEDAVATKTASDLNLFPDLNVRMETRQVYSIKYEDANQVASKDLKYTFKPIINNKWFSKKLNTDLYLGVQKKNGEGRFTTIQPELYSWVSVPVGKYFDLWPSADLLLPQGSKALSGPVGFEPQVSKDFEFKKMGTFSPFAVVETMVNVSNKNSDRTVETSGGRSSQDFGITATDDTKTPGQATQKDAEKDSTYNVNPYIGFTYKMPVFTKWSATAFTRMEVTYAPEHKAVGNGEIETKYGMSRTRWDDVIIAYKADSKLSFNTETRFFHKGLYQMQSGAAATDNPRYYNRLVMTYKL